jgi:hypothetical protein
MKNLMWIGLFCFGCVAPAPADNSRTAELAAITQRLDHLDESLAKLSRRAENLEDAVSFASAEGELTTMTIDDVRWYADVFLESEQQANVLLCHVEEWKGFGKMKRFTSLADNAFRLEAEGHPIIAAFGGTGGVCNSDGSSRYVMLRVQGALDPEARYALVPQNTKERYRWTVRPDVVVTARSSAR